MSTLIANWNLGVELWWLHELFVPYSKVHDVFKTAMAVAPVTNWKFYDSIYTERYMQTPQENSGIR